MTLDEIEKDAAHVVKHWAGMPSHATAERLARALLLVMPVVRASLGIADDETNAVSAYALAHHRKVWRDAIDTMRRGLEEG